MSTLLPASLPAKQHPARSWAEIAAEQRGPLLRYAARLLADPDRAQDVVQDVLVKFMAQDPNDLAGREAEWLFTVCRHRALDVLRKNERMEAMTPDQADGHAGSEAPPSRALEEAETQARLLEIIRSLRPNQQEVIRLKFQKGFSCKEIAAITNLSAGNVGFLLHTAIARLRREFRETIPG